MKSNIGCLAPWRTATQMQKEVVTLSAKSKHHEPIVLKPYEPRFVAIEHIKNRQQPIKIFIEGINRGADVHVLLSTSYQYPNESDL